jgi:hypothetical protein
MNQTDLLARRRVAEPPRNRAAAIASTLPIMAVRTLFLHTLLVAIVLAFGACKKDDFANETIGELSALADQIVKEVDGAEDKRAGVAAAQQLLDARKDELSSKMKEIRELRRFQVSEDVVANINAVRDEAATKVKKLELSLIAHVYRDAELDEALHKLITDFDELVDGE